MLVNMAFTLLIFAVTWWVFQDPRGIMRFYTPYVGYNYCRWWLIILIWMASVSYTHLKRQAIADRAKEKNLNTTVLEKIQSELERSGCDAFLLTGGDNMRYAAQVHLPFTDEHPGLAFVLFAKGRLPLVLSPSLWARSWERGIISDVRALALIHISKIHSAKI